MRNWLVDKSAYVRMQARDAARLDQWNQRTERGLVRLSTVTRLEIGFAVDIRVCWLELAPIRA